MTARAGRVKKLTCSGGASCTPASPNLKTTIFVYDAAGQLAAEYTLETPERLSARLEGTFTNVLNRVNLADPILDITNKDFGRITNARGTDFGGGRTGQLSLRLEF